MKNCWVMSLWCCLLPDIEYGPCCLNLSKKLPQIWPQISYNHYCLAQNMWRYLRVGHILLYSSFTSHEPQHDKTNKMTYASSKDSDQPGHLPHLIIAVSVRKPWILSYPLSAKWRLRSACADALADLSLCWADMSFCWFCHAAAHIWLAMEVRFNELSRLVKISMHTAGFKPGMHTEKSYMISTLLAQLSARLT